MVNELQNRDPRNAPGPFYVVKDLCLSCGMPEDEAPDLLADLEATNGDSYFVKQPTTPKEIERACNAIDVCCTDALRYAGDDPAILQRLGRSKPYCCDVNGGMPIAQQIQPPRKIELGRVLSDQRRVVIGVCLVSGLFAAAAVWIAYDLVINRWVFDNGWLGLIALIFLAIPVLVFARLCCMIPDRGGRDHAT